MRNIKYIIIHCSATVKGQSFDADDIDEWHKKRGFKGIGYHFVVLLNGDIQLGRPEEIQGAHVKGFNRNSLGICYVGGLDEQLKPTDTRTLKQKEGLECLLIELKLKYPKAKILGHRDFSKDKNNNGIIEPFEFSKECPCYDAKKEYKHL